MVNHTSALTFSKKGSVISKIALGAASLMMLTVISSATMAGATPLEDSGKNKDSTSRDKNHERDNDNRHEKNDDKNNEKDDDKKNDKERGDHKNRGNHGYGGGNGNAVNSDVSINQSGHDNVLTVIINYIFG